MTCVKTLIYNKIYENEVNFIANHAKRVRSIILNKYVKF